MDLAKIVEFFTNNWKELSLIGTSIITVASIIVKMTPGTEDDEKLNKIVKFLKMLSIPHDTKKK